MANRVQPLSVVGWAWRGVLAVAGRPVVWGPFLLIAAVQLAAILFFTSFHHKALLPLALPLVRLLAGEAATHYPILFFALPTMFFKANLVISVLISSIAGGAATLLFAKAFGFAEGLRPWKRALRFAPALILVTILLVGILFGISYAQQLIPEQTRLNSFGVRWGVRGVSLFLFILVQSFLVYATAWIVLMGHRIGPAIRDSVRVSYRTFIPTFLVVGIPAVLLYPFSYLTNRVDLFVDKLSPELLAWLLGAQVVAEMLLTFLLVGAVVRLFLWRVEAAR